MRGSRGRLTTGDQRIRMHTRALGSVSTALLWGAALHMLVSEGAATGVQQGGGGAGKGCSGEGVMAPARECRLGSKGTHCPGS